VIGKPTIVTPPALIRPKFPPNLQFLKEMPMHALWGTLWVALSAILALSLAPPAVAGDAGQVDVELVLAVDVSRSMDIEEFELQREGYVEALRHPEFVQAVQAGRTGRIALTYFEWASSPREESLVAWRIIDGPASAEAFAAELASRPFSGFRGTSISAAIDFGAGLFDRNAVDSPRHVIDVSGDGPNNMGRPVIGSRNAALAQGVIINGLPILVRPSRTQDQLDRYYAECVIGGPGSFVLPIREASEFATAIRRKLILEVSGVMPEARVINAQAPDISACLVGERNRRLFTDPYFPELDR